MLVTANVDGYPTDDDVTAINRFLKAAGDRKLIVPDDIADWIISKIGHLGPSATPRLIGGYIHFLRGAAITPPFDGGAPATARNRLLRAMEADLRARGTPVAELALLMFQESNDPFQVQLAQSADYSALRSFPWLVGQDDWMNWIFDGLQPGAPSKPVNNQAKAGLLVHVRSFVSSLDIHPPVSASAINFIFFMNVGNSWGHLKGGPTVPVVNWKEIENEESALGKVMSHRIAATLAVPVADDKLVETSVEDLIQRGIVGTLSLGELYRRSVGIPNSVAPAFQVDRFHRLSEVLSAQQWRLLALGSFALVAYQRSHQNPSVDLAMDQVFVQLAATDLPPAEKRTTVVSSISGAEASAAAKTDIADLARCKPKSLEIVSRLISLRDRRFLESINATCNDNTQLKVSKLGIIPTDLVRMLELNPNYLDMVQVSLAVRDLTGSTSNRHENPEDLDLIRANPEKATAEILAALAHREAAWSYVRDVLLQDWPVPIEWITPGWRASPPITLFPTPGRSSLLTSDDFTTWRKEVLAAEMDLLENKARWRFYNGVWPTVVAMPDSVDNGCDLLSELLSFGGSCGTATTYTARRRLLGALNDIAAEANRPRELKVSLSDPQCVAHAHDGEEVSFGINEDTREFLAVYRTGPCYGMTEGKIDDLKLPPALNDWLMGALNQDPLFLNRYQLNILSSDDWTKRIIPAMSEAGAESGVASQSLDYLQSTDFLYYWPSLAPPLGQWETHRPATEFVGDRKVAVDLMTAPLLKSNAGQQLAEDLAALEHFANVLPPVSVASQLELSDDFIGLLRDAENKSIQSVYDKVDQQVKDTNDKLNPQQQSNFEVGFSVGVGQSTSVGLFFKYEGVGIDVFLPSLSLPENVVLTPTMPSFNLPAVSLLLPGAGLSEPIALPATPTADPFAAGVSDDQTTEAVLENTPSIPSEINVSLSDLNWGSLLAKSNNVGRTLLNNEIKIATPLLTQDQLKHIADGINQASFPIDLAKVITEKAAEALSKEPDVPVEVALSNQSVEETCESGTWSSCGLAVKEELDKKPSDPRDVIRLAGIWGKAFNVQYEFLRQRGHLERAIPEPERAEEILSSYLDPREIAMDKLKDIIKDPIEAAIKDAFIKCLSQLGFAIAWGSKPVMNASIGAFFQNLPETESQYDELVFMDEVMQEEIGQQLEPFMDPTWQTQFLKAIDQSVPQWQVPLR